MLAQGQYGSAGFLAAQQGIAQHFHHNVGGNPEQPVGGGDRGGAQCGHGEQPHMTTAASQAPGAESAPQAAANGHPLQYHMGQGYQVSSV